MRDKITVRNFAEGAIIKGEHIGQVGTIRLRGWKLGERLGTLTSRGGIDDWSPSVPYTNILGIHRWYREDGGRHLLMFDGSNGRINHLKLSDLSTIIVGTYTQPYDKNSICLFENCGSLLIGMPLGSMSRPFAIRVNRSSGYLGAIDGSQLLGLDPPPDVLWPVTGAFAAGVNHMDPAGGLADGEYFYCATRLYGPRDNPSKYGESEPGPITAVNLKANAGSFHRGIIQINGLDPVTASTAYQCINIYRTKKGGGTFYRVGQVTAYGLANFNDTLGDDHPDFPSDKVLPTATGIAYGMRCAAWHPTLKRLYWFGEDGYFHWSEPGYPDVNPVNNRMEVGSIGYKGNGIKFIRGTTYLFKEDGVFILSGSAPNYVSAQVDKNGCYARGSVAQVGNGNILYVGRLRNKVAVFSFDGNGSQRVSEQVQDCMPNATHEVLNRICSEVYGNEYFLSLTSYDPRYVLWPLSFNNLLLIYNYENGWWSDFPAQAGGLEVMDGPGDSGELLHTESDPTVDRGNLFCWYSTGWKMNQTGYLAGAEQYYKGAVISRRVFIGNIVADTPTLQEISALEFDVIIRGYTDKQPLLQTYADNRFNDQVIDNELSPEEDEQALRIADSSKFGKAAAVYGTARFAPIYTSRRHFKVVDDSLRTGISLDLRCPVRSSGELLEIEAAEIVIDSTENE